MFVRCDFTVWIESPTATINQPATSWMVAGAQFIAVKRIFERNKTSKCEIFAIRTSVVLPDVKRNALEIRFHFPILILRCLTSPGENETKSNREREREKFLLWNVQKLISKIQSRLRLVFGMYFHSFGCYVCISLCVPALLRVAISLQFFIVVCNHIDWSTFSSARCRNHFYRIGNSAQLYRPLLIPCIYIFSLYFFFGVVFVIVELWIVCVSLCVQFSLSHS